MIAQRISMAKFGLLSLCLGLLLSLSGCYIIEVQQGNIIDDREVAKLKVGMSKREVAEILGNSVVENTFNDDHRDYVYTFRDHRQHVTHESLHLSFTDNRLQTIKRKHPTVDDNRAGKNRKWHIKSLLKFRTRENSHALDTNKRGFKRWLSWMVS